MSGPNSGELDSTDDSLPIGAIIDVWWRKRASLAVLALAGALLAFLLAAGLYLGRPVSRPATLNFRLQFKGVEQGKYPNGDRFAPSDILATAVLDQVYAQDELARFIKFDDFKTGLAVMANNPALNALRRDYEDRLAARTITAADRQKLENEYQEKAAALQNTEFTISIDFGSRFRAWPATLAAKILPDIIDAWLELSRARGVFRFNASVFSENILPANTTDSSYLIYVDELRETIKRVQGNIDDLLEFPGARQMRGGAKLTSLAELRAQLDDVVKYRIGTVESVLMLFGFHQNKDLEVAYLRDQIFHSQLATEELSAQAKTIADVQGSYLAARSTTRPQGSAAGESDSALGMRNGTMITQLSDSFLDRMMSLSEKSSDVAFRQRLADRSIDIGNKIATIETSRTLFDRQLASLSGETDATPNAAEIKQWIDLQLDGTLAQLKSTLADLQVFQQELSQRNLDPGTAYQLMGPMLPMTITPLGVGKIAAYAFMLGAFVFGTGLIIVTWQGIRSAQD
jgi:hypothetical protein